jgi:mono/diheme cytochrome c family protein
MIIIAYLKKVLRLPYGPADKFSDDFSRRESMALTPVRICLSLLLLSACSEAPTRAVLGGSGNAGGVPSGTKIDEFVPAEKLTLGAVAADEASQKSYDFAKPSEISWASASEVVMAHGDGKSISFDFKQSRWSSVHTNSTVSEYSKLYDFRSAGFYGSTADVLSFRVGEGSIARLNAPDGFTEESALGINPGFVAYAGANGPSAIVAGGETASLYPLTGAPDGIKLLAPCNKHCLLWGFDGTKVYIYFAETGWRPIDQNIVLPAGQTIARMAIRFRDTNNPVAAESIIVQSDKGTLYAQVAGTVKNSDPTWTEIKVISDRFCATCHIDDGFEKETTWKSLKGSIVTRLKMAPGTKGAMPPTETNIGKEMSQGERDVILAWIEKQEQIDRGEIGSTTDPVADNSDVSGELKTYSDKYCLSCHADAKKNSFWTTKKADSKARIESGNMPKGQSLSAAEKTKFLSIISAIK